MRRIQLHLEEELDDALGAQARERGIPKAALIRQYLRRHVRPSPRGEDDPSTRFIGSYQGDSAGSESVDDIVYGP